DTLSVAPSDVFPEQFEHFIVGKRPFKEMLKAKHGDLMTSEYWRRVQKETSKGEIHNFTPYPQSRRFSRHPDRLAQSTPATSASTNNDAKTSDDLSYCRTIELQHLDNESNTLRYSPMAGAMG
ncbi:MAG: isocitrate dehydrogenase kinase/phosphatase-domain containing protein, partial [Pseudomonadota bacterium]|nr:isocitrate dehydrogenase kinase/phosphatase-domain containing protein [Pseudomonadota bacterium]